MRKIFSKTIILMLLSLLYVLFLGNFFVLNENTNDQVIFIQTTQQISVEQQLSSPSSIKTDKRNEQRSVNEIKETNTPLLDKNKNDFKRNDFYFFVLFCQYFNTKVHNTIEVLLPLPIYLYWCKMLI